MDLSVYTDINDVKLKVSQYILENRDNPPIDMEHIVTTILEWDIIEERIMFDDVNNSYYMILQKSNDSNQLQIVLDPSTRFLKIYEFRTRFAILVTYFCHFTEELEKIDTIGFLKGIDDLPILHEYNSVYPYFLSRDLPSGRVVGEFNRDKHIDYKFSYRTSDILDTCQYTMLPNDDIISRQANIIGIENKLRYYNKVKDYNIVLEEIFKWIGFDFLSYNDMEEKILG